ncbi:unnamed protein product, partial [Trichogramma brassicae]
VSPLVGPPPRALLVTNAMRAGWATHSLITGHSPNYSIITSFRGHNLGLSWPKKNGRDSNYAYLYLQLERSVTNRRLASCLLDGRCRLGKRSYVQRESDGLTGIKRARFGARREASTYIGLIFVWQVSTRNVVVSWWTMRTPDQQTLLQQKKSVRTPQFAGFRGEHLRAGGRGTAPIAVLSTAGNEPIYFIK